MDRDLLISIINSDMSVIPYRKKLNGITGDPKASILLQQMIYWSKITGWRKFYKFIEPCSHPLYKSGDSWVEQLGFSVSEFQTALKRIATKITTGVRKGEVLKKDDVKSLIIYWTDSSRTTWYQINVSLLGKLLKKIYLEDGETKDILNKDYTESSYINNRSSNEENTNKHLNNNNQSVFDSPDTLYPRHLDIEDTVNYYYGAYEKYRGNFHPILKREQEERVKNVLKEFSQENHIDQEEWEMVVDYWFNGGVKPNKTDFNLNHFATKGILEVLFREAPR